MINLDNYLTIGAKLFHIKEKDPEAAFVELFLQNRIKAASIVAEAHEGFDPLFQAMVHNSNNVDLVPFMTDEYDAMIELLSKDTYLSRDIYFKVSLVAQGAVLYRHNERDLTALSGFIDSFNEQEMKSVTGLEPIILIVVALWFTNYNGFQQSMFHRYQALKQNGELT